MNIKITPHNLIGEVKVPDSKSYSHRLLIAAALAGVMDKVELNTFSADILATKNALSILSKKTDPIKKELSTPNVYDAVEISCNESGSTLRFMLPITMALLPQAKFYGAGKLPERPLSPLWEQLEEHGVKLSRNTNAKEEYNSNGEVQKLICTGNGVMEGGDFFLPGNISSQYVTGLLFALPLTEKGGVIHMTSKLESKSYVHLTLSVLKDFGIEVLVENDKVSSLTKYVVKGQQSYTAPLNLQTEGDWSAAAFWIVAKTLGSNITCNGTNINSLQGDKEILNIVNTFNVDASSNLKVSYADQEFDNIIDATNIPDLVPIISVLMAVTPGKHKIIGAARLRIKESDRLAAMCTNLNTVGANVKEFDDGLEIEGKEFINGCTVSGYNDHRIVMAMAIAAIKSKGPLIIQGAQAVTKSYPDFFSDYEKLGGIVNEI